MGATGLCFLLIYLANASWLAPERSGRPFLLAHRGLGQAYDRAGLSGSTCTAARLEPSAHSCLENTLPSIQAAFGLGAAIVEFDVQPTRDGHFVVFHDADLGCRTEAIGSPRDYPLEALQGLDVGYGYSADGGKTFPFRGRGVGLMPSLEDVLVTFPAGRFLIDIKAGSAADGKRLGVRLAALQSGRSGAIWVYGRPAVVEAVTQAAPLVRPVTRPRLKACLARYLALGWSGYVPEACRRTLLTVPANVAPWLWGWPGRLLHRLDRVGTGLVLLGDYGGEGFSTPIDDPDWLKKLPPGFDGGIWTDRIDRLAPHLGLASASDELRQCPGRE